MLKFTCKALFLTIKKADEILVMKIQRVAHAVVPPLHNKGFSLKNIKIRSFGGISKFLELTIIGQILLCW
jgi:hypothetical protein